MKNLFLILVLSVLSFSCKDSKASDNLQADEHGETSLITMQKNLSKYVSVKLTADLSQLTEKEREMLPILIQAADKMNDLFWYQSYGNKTVLLNSMTDEDSKSFVKINYGPWDRLNGNVSFIEGISDKPKGANFYPADMTKEEFETAEIENKSSIYNFVRRDDNGNLYSIPYHKQLEKELAEVSKLLLKASKLAEDEGLKTYLELRAQALLDDNYQPSD